MFVAARNMTTCEDRTRRVRATQYFLYTDYVEGTLYGKELHICNLDAMAKDKNGTVWAKTSIHKIFV